MNYDKIVPTCIVKGVEYKIVDFGGSGNCLFLAVAGSLSAMLPTSNHDHKSLRKGVSRWYIENGLQHQAYLNAKPVDVIFDNPDLPTPDVFRTWTWQRWGLHIAKNGVWGGASEIMPFNMVLPYKYKLNIIESVSGVIYGEEHNERDDNIVFVYHRGLHYLALINSNCAFEIPKLKRSIVSMNFLTPQKCTVKGQEYNIVD